MNHTVKCSNCGILLDELPTSTKSQPCPKCGSNQRTIAVLLEEKIKTHDMLKCKVKEQSTKRPVIELQKGDDLHRNSGKWYEKERVIDRKNDRYKELIKDPKTGEIIHQCEEPLSEHWGHGSAKHKEGEKNV